MLSILILTPGRTKESFDNISNLFFASLTSTCHKVASIGGTIFTSSGNTPSHKKLNQVSSKCLFKKSRLRSKETSIIFLSRTPNKTSNSAFSWLKAVYNSDQLLSALKILTAANSKARGKYPNVLASNLASLISLSSSFLLKRLVNNSRDSSSVKQSSEYNSAPTRSAILAKRVVIIT